MLNVELNEKTGVATLKPEGALSESDFINAANVIDPYLKEHAMLNGLIIYTKKFPGWDSIKAMIGHFKFIKEHQKSITHIALVTDSEIGDWAEDIADYFQPDKVEHFSYDELDDAQAWITESKNA